jgi:DNA end-binding protein Ku
MKPVWSGSLSFGLVNIPINLYTTIRPPVTAFHMLCATCNHPIKYERWCPRCKKEVTWEHVVKGIDLGNNKFFVLTKEHIEKLKPQKSDVFQIIEFISTDKVPPIFYENHYYAIANKSSHHAFSLFKTALEETKTTALGSFVMREKEHLAVITPYQDIFLISTLHYSYEMYLTSALPKQPKTAKIQAGELKLAKQLIDQLTVKTFDIARFKDTFAQHLIQEIKKGKSKKIRKTQAKEKPIKLAKDKTLTTMLKASLKKHPKPSIHHRHVGHA